MDVDDTNAFNLNDQENCYVRNTSVAGTALLSSSHSTPIRLYDVTNAFNLNDHMNCDVRNPSLTENVLLSSTHSTSIRRYDDTNAINLNDNENCDVTNTSVTGNVLLSSSHSTSYEDETSFNFRGRGSRKKRKNTKRWKQNKRKTKKNSGLTYTTKKGIVVEKKALIGKIEKCCKFNCFSKFTEEDLQKINKEYWALGNFSRQRDFINYNVNSNSCKRSKAGGSQRKFTYIYQLMEKKVCKTLFLSVLKIGQKTVQIVKQKQRNNIDVGFDSRGKGKTNNTSTETLDLVRLHIQLFPLLESHYGRKDSKRLYLSADLNQSKMYDLYVEYMEKNYSGKEIVPASMYKHIFCTEFNISFHVPKKDACKYCEKLKDSTDSNEQLEYKAHIERKELAREEKNKDKVNAQTDETFKSFTFDLQAVLYSPSSNVSSFFYTRKFASYNLTFYDMAEKHGSCYIWNETHGNRGSDEISTILLRHLKSMQPSITHVSFFSDSCGGQNRNRFVACMLKYAVSTIPTLETIDLKFLEVGHTDMEVDSMHSVIERAKKNKNIFSPLEYPNIIRDSKRRNPYDVEVLQFNEFFDLKKFKDEYIKGKLQSQEIIFL